MQGRHHAPELCAAAAAVAVTGQPCNTVADWCARRTLLASWLELGTEAAVVFVDRDG